MDGYVNSLAQLDDMDWSEWEEVIDWAAARDDAMLIGTTNCSHNALPSDLYRDHLAAIAPYINEFDCRFQSSETNCFSGVSLDLDRVLASKIVQDVGDCVESGPPQVSGKDAYTQTFGVLNGAASSARNSSLRQGKQARSKRDQRLFCTYDGCGFRDPFPRPYELNRHIKATHSGDRSFTCPIEKCSRGFARADKLIAHIRVNHGGMHHRVDALQCPSDGCTASLDLEMLSLHIRIAHSVSFEKPGLLRAVATAGSTMYVECPFQTTCPWMRPQDIPQHLLKHVVKLSKIRLTYFAREIFSRHYTIVGPTGLAATNWDQIQHICETETVIGIAVECPVCKQPCSDHASFEAHFDESHLIALSRQEHFIAWRQCVQMSRVLKDNRAVRPWMSWKLRKDWINVQCPSCDFSREKVTIDRSNNHLEVDHRLHMLADSQDLVPYRRAVLMLYPDFGSHPIWSDLA